MISKRCWVTFVRSQTNRRCFYFVPSSPQLCIEDTVFGLVFVNYELACESPTEVPYYVAFANPLCFFFVEVRSIKLFERPATRFAVYATKGDISQRRKSRELPCRLNHRKIWSGKLILTARGWKSKQKNIYLSKLPNISIWKQTFFGG